MIDGIKIWLPVQTNESLRQDISRKNKPWTKDELERVRLAALAMVRTHRVWEIDKKHMRPSFDGAAYWALLGALDRAGSSTTEDD